MSFGTDILLLIALGFVVLGPKRMHKMLHQAVRMKADFDRAARSVKRELEGLAQENPKGFSSDSAPLRRELKPARQSCAPD